MQSIYPIEITKASGKIEPFNEAKFVKSLAASGMSPNVASQTLDYLKHHLKPGFSTQDISQHVTEYLHENASPSEYFNYGLKNAVMQLGPAGHALEILVSDVLNFYGYRTEVSIIALGRCISHEIDIMAYKEGRQYIVECKFHNSPGMKTDVQVALYTQARFQDVREALEKNHGENIEYNSWLVTNTKVTSEVIDYAKCVGMQCTAWTYPKDKGLHEMIIDSKLHPVTVINTLKQEKKNLLINRGIVTCARLQKAIGDDSVRDILNDKESQLAVNEIKEFIKENG